MYVCIFSCTSDHDGLDGALDEGLDLGPEHERVQLAPPRQPRAPLCREPVPRHTPHAREPAMRRRCRSSLAVGAAVCGGCGIRWA
eukprot:825115-Rhodomonas_salina.2